MSSVRFIIDFTYNPENKESPLKILELGNFYDSEFSGLNYLRKDKNKIEEECFDELKKNNPTALYIERNSLIFGLNIQNFSNNMSEHYSFKHCEASKYCLEDFLTSRANTKDFELTPLIANIPFNRLSFRQFEHFEKMHVSNKNFQLPNRAAVLPL